MTNLRKKITSMALALSMVFSFAIPGYAHGETATTTSATTTVAASTNDPAARTTRIDTYKKSLKETLTAAAKTRITDRCAAAQAIVKTKATNNTTATTARLAAYDTILHDLDSVSDAASAKGASVATLQANITALKAKITTFTTANTAYQDSLGDLSVLDCKTDPIAFKAALESSRTNQVATFTAAKDIRTYLTDTVKPTLVAIKTALGAAAQ